MVRLLLFLGFLAACYYVYTIWKATQVGPRGRIGGRPQGGSEPSDWAYYPAKVNHKSASISLWLDYGDRARRAGLITMYTALMDMVDGDTHGMGCFDEANHMRELDSLRKTELTSLGFQQVGVVRSDGIWQVVYYGPADRHLEFDAVVHGTGERLGRKGKAIAKPDPGWTYFDDFLWPDEERMQWIMNSRLVDQLERNGDNAHISREVDYACSFAASESASEFSSALGQFGVEAKVDGPEEARSAWLVTFTRKEPVDLDSIHGFVMQLIELAKQHDGQFDGWGCEVQA